MRNGILIRQHHKLIIKYNNINDMNIDLVKKTRKNASFHFYKDIEKAKQMYN